jgi:adenosylcobinamide-GDP ribazoletransferase
VSGSRWSASGLRLAVSMFTVIPVSTADGDVSVQRPSTGTAIRWLPVVGALLGVLAGLVTAAITLRAPNASTLAAVVGVAVLAGLSGGLHLDGLADTADGLASRASAARALEIMRRSDIGPFGVVAIAVVLLLDVSALATVVAGDTAWRGPAALGVAAMTARLSAVYAARPGVRAARGDGFGALVTGTSAAVTAVGLTAVALAGGALAAWLTDASVLGWVLSQSAALALAAVLQWLVVRRLGGMTGDVFGALIEVTGACVLVGFALS